MSSKQKRNLSNQNLQRSQITQNMQGLKGIMPNIKIVRTELRDKSEIHDLEKQLYLGRILFIKTREFFEKYESDIVFLRNSINYLKNVVSSFGGSMGRIGKDILVLSPYQKIKIG